MSDLPLLILVPCLLGTIMLIIGLTLAVRRGRRRRDWVHTRGTVVGWRHSMVGSVDRDGGVSVPQVAFTTREGREITTGLGYGVDLGVYPTGGEVDVWYDPADPMRAQANVMGTGCVPYVLILAGVVLAGLGW